MWTVPEGCCDSQELQEAPPPRAAHPALPRGRRPENAAHYLTLQHWSKGCTGCAKKLPQISQLLQCFFTVVIPCFPLLFPPSSTIDSPWQNPTWRCFEKGIVGITLAPSVQCRGRPRRGWQWCQGDNRQLACFVITLISVVLQNSYYPHFLNEKIATQRGDVILLKV